MSGEHEWPRRDEPPFAFEDVWPDDQPFPLTDAECARLVRGHPVRPRAAPDTPRSTSLPHPARAGGSW